MSPSEASASGSAGRRRKSSESDEAPATAGRTGGRRRAAGGRRKQQPKRFKGLIAVVVALLVVALAALGAVLYMQGEDTGDSAGAAPQTRPATYRVIDAGGMNDVLATREADSRPLNEGELFGERSAEISSQDIDFTLRDSELTEDCAAAVWGQDIEQALAAADCTQAARATYVADDYFGVVAVFNLADVGSSRDVATAMAEPEPAPGEESPAPEDLPGFVLAPSGAEPFDRMGSGYSSSDAIISGHYLVVVWVQPTESESVDDRVSLSSPLVALSNFRDPLYRRMVQLEAELGGTGEDTGTETDPVGTAPESDAAVPGAGG